MGDNLKNESTKIKRKGVKVQSITAKKRNKDQSMTRSRSAATQQPGQAMEQTEEITEVNLEQKCKTNDQEKLSRDQRNVITKQGMNYNAQLDLNANKGQKGDRTSKVSAKKSKVVDDRMIPFGYERRTVVMEGDLRNDKKVTNSIVDDVYEEMDGIQVSVNPADDEFDTDSQLESENEYTQEAGPSTVSSKQKLTRSESLRQDPEIQKWVMELVQEKVQKELATTTSSSRKNTATGKNDNGGQNTIQENDGITSPLIQQGIKSPSDTTIYMPALRKGVQTNNALDRISDFVENIRIEQK